jgi:hypothetical protein
MVVVMVAINFGSQFMSKVQVDSLFLVFEGS